jgi:hypothetical protein
MIGFTVQNQSSKFKKPATIQTCFSMAMLHFMNIPIGIITPKEIAHINKRWHHCTWFFIKKELSLMHSFFCLFHCVCYPIYSNTCIKVTNAPRMDSSIDPALDSCQTVNGDLTAQICVEGSGTHGRGSLWLFLQLNTLLPRSRFYHS